MEQVINTLGHALIISAQVCGITMLASFSILIIILALIYVFSMICLIFTLIGMLAWVAYIEIKDWVSDRWLNLMEWINGNNNSKKTGR